MRIIQLRIGSKKPVPTHRFKNLKDVTIDFDRRHWVTVLVGWNGTGKSNVLEALAIIFRDLISKSTRPSFAFLLKYIIGQEQDAIHVEIDADPERTRRRYMIYVTSATQSRDHGTLQLPFDGKPQICSRSGRQLTITEFLKGDTRYLPSYVFSYYSGESRRMQEIFLPYLERYDGALRRGRDPGMKRLFYALPVHSQFVLLAFLMHSSDDMRTFLRDNLGLDSENGIESILFVLRQPPWKSNASDGDPRFWYARGVVSDFLNRLYDVALAPIDVIRSVRVSLWNSKRLQFKYLFVKDLDSLRSLVGDQHPADFFRDVESTHVSQLIEEIRIRIRIPGSDGSVTFRELSEGEQQLLTVLGLLRFTAESESLFLLDEPDTHLNPRWCLEYISYLRRFLHDHNQRIDSSHILVATHNPLSIAELERGQVHIFRSSENSESPRIVAAHPELDPRGLGYAAIVVSDMFGIASSLDRPTQTLLEEQRSYASKTRLSTDEQARLDDVNAELERLGFRFFHPDDEYSRYLRLRNDALMARFGTNRPRDLARKTVDLDRTEREALAKRLIEELVENPLEEDESTQG